MQQSVIIWGIPFRRFFFCSSSRRDRHVLPSVSSLFTPSCFCPQLFMCLVWILLQIVAATMYYDLQPAPLTHSSKAGPRVSQDALEEGEVEPLLRCEAGTEEAAEGGGYGSAAATERREPSLGDATRYVPNGHLVDEESADEKEKGPFHDFSSMRGELSLLWKKRMSFATFQYPRLFI